MYRETNIFVILILRLSTHYYTIINSNYTKASYSKREAFFISEYPQLLFRQLEI
jgi:hypothetical protein